MFSPPLTRSRARKLREQLEQQQQQQQAVDGENVGHHHEASVAIAAAEMEAADGNRKKKHKKQIDEGEGEDRRSSRDRKESEDKGKKKPLSPSAAQMTQAPSKRVKELQLTEEEAGLKGAPEGAVYEVSVLNAEDIEPSKDPEAEMQHALQLVGADANAENWAEQHAAVDSIRRMALHHPGVLTAHIDGAVKIVLGATMSLRSSMVRNSLLAVKELFEHASEAMEPFTEEAVATVLRRTSGDKKFLCECAISTLATIAQQGAFQPTLNGLTTGVQSKNADIAAHALKGLDDLTTRFFRKSMLRQQILGSDSSAEAATHNVQTLLDALVAGLNSRNPAGKSAARATLRKMRQSLTPEVFEQKARALLPESAAEELLREATRPAAGSSKSVSSINRGVSIRERILAAQKQQGSTREAGAQSSNGEIVVEFKTKDETIVMNGVV